MTILGIDEVGRGPWAGPLVVGACILPDYSSHDINSLKQISDNPNLSWIDHLTDSKKLSAKARSELNTLILRHCATGLGWVSAPEIDQIGLAQSLRLATKRAVQAVQSHHLPFSEIIIDGTTNFLSNTPLSAYVTALKKADLNIKAVSAASIIAKVARDNYMISLAKKFPMYGFEKHVGYGTALHQSALKEFGPCAEHRFSFAPIAKLLKKDQADSLRSTSDTDSSSPIISPRQSNRGQQAEFIVVNFLKSNGHYIIAKNFKTKFYEIDIISLKDDKIYFTEVKYRKNKLHGSPLEAINQAKRQQIKFAAQAFISSISQNNLTSPQNIQTLDHQAEIDRKTIDYILLKDLDFTNLQPILAVASVIGPDFKIEDWFTI